MSFEIGFVKLTATVASVAMIGMSVRVWMSPADPLERPMKPLKEYRLAGFESPFESAGISNAASLAPAVPIEDAEDSDLFMSFAS